MVVGLSRPPFGLITPGSVQGALVQLVVFLGDRRWRECPIPAWRRPVPFGPFLAIGALE
jgi:prepilin signal peptidase PulO-like enzyme (type II secretory pathway)